jgi:N-acetyl-anhydromuramyl-L-alanine amidase AmpD
MLVAMLAVYSLLSHLAPLALLGLVAAEDTSISIAGHKYDVGRRVVPWTDRDKGFNGYSETCVEESAVSSSVCCARPFKRYGRRPGVEGRDLEKLRAVVSQLVLHHDGCPNSRSCFYSMHDMPRRDGGCGLSSHFMIDSDGTIYQTLDVAERAYHARDVNEISVGVEICNLADAGRERRNLPLDYATRPTRSVVINGRTYNAFDFRPEQYASVIALARTLVGVFPRIKPAIPMNGKHTLLETLPVPTAFEGIVGHLHVDASRNKWDPGAFDWDSLLSGLNGYFLPVDVQGHKRFPTGDRAGIVAVARAAFHNAEERASGFYPISAAGLWHSGIHLRGPRGAGVRAPARGTLLAARLGEVNGSSTSFVLIRHEAPLGDQTIRYYSLLAHLAPLVPRPSTPIPWVRELMRARDQAAIEALMSGKVALLRQRVESGEVIGHVGLVRRGPEQGQEIRFETFSEDRLPATFDQFRYFKARGDGPFVRRGVVLSALGESSAGGLSAETLRRFFRSEALDRRQALRRLALQHVHEWGSANTVESFLRAPELSALPEDERRLLFDNAVAGYQFWDDRLSYHAGLPKDQVIHSYNPILLLASLSAVQSGIPLRWPAAAIPDEVMPALPLPRAALEAWLRPPPLPPEPPPIFSGFVFPEVKIPRRVEIPLIPTVSDHAE